MRTVAISVAVLCATACRRAHPSRACADAPAAPMGPVTLPRDVPQLDHLGTIVGTVRAAATGRAIPGAEAILVSGTRDTARAGGTAPPTARVDSLGGFVLAAGAGTATLRVRAPGYALAERPVVLATERVETLHVTLGTACAARR